MKRFLISAAVLVVLGVAATAMATPPQITPAASLNLGYGQAGSRAAASGAYVYTADGGQLTVFDLTSPTAPAKVAALTGAGGLDLATLGRYVFVGGPDALTVVDVSTPTAPVLVNTFSGLGGNKMSLSSYYLVTAAGSASNGIPNQLRIVDISIPTSPTLTASLSLTGTPTAVAVSGNYAFVTMENSLLVVDISNPAAPQQSTVLTFPTMPNGDTTRGIAVSGNLAYVTAHGVFCDDEGCTLTNGTLYLVDISQPLCPKVVSSVVTLKAAEDIVVSGQFAYIVEQSVDFYPGHTNFLVVNVANSADPQLVGYYQSNVLNGYSQGLTVIGNYVFEAITTGANVFNAFASAPPVCTP
ncbi:LVIVD repeat-containing protein [Geobacter sp. AOG2]|uniref:LVIVD repeat-containing protein n=1 Tax=Geobacter sp. AOG2 TaxID=1566347 RepID=UPI001CC43D80|nr:hypothetical protein [Geobacter sp. AOG2]GFE61102.1 hypothetical protein AOG2_16890 [Geobacter sp. AOG2]